MKNKTKKFTLYTSEGLIQQEGRDIYDAARKAEQYCKWVRKPDNNGSKSARKYYKKLARKLYRLNNFMDWRSVRIYSGKHGWYSRHRGRNECD